MNSLWLAIKPSLVKSGNVCLGVRERGRLLLTAVFSPSNMPHAILLQNNIIVPFLNPIHRFSQLLEQAPPLVNISLYTRIHDY